MAAADLRGLRILVVEDDYMIATDVALRLEKCGVEVIGPAGSVAQARQLVEQAASLDAAVLDINLGDETVFPVAEALAARGVPFVFATGYSALAVPAAYLGVPRIEKPIDIVVLVRLLAARIQPGGGDDRGAGTSAHRPGADDPASAG